MSFIYHNYNRSMLNKCQYFKSNKELIDCIDELKLRYKYLSNSKSKDANNLASKIESCDIGEYCKSATCPICCHIYKISITEDIMAILDKLVEPRVVTLVNLSDLLKGNKISKNIINKMLNNLYKNLQRIGYHGIAIGSFEADFHSENKCWMLHFHLLMEYNVEVFMKLRNFMNRSKNMNARDGVTNRPMHVGMLRDPEKQITYIFKTQWKRVELYQGSDGQRRTKDYRLRDEQFIHALTTLDKIGLSGLRFMYGITRSKSGLSLKHKTK